MRRCIEFSSILPRRRVHCIGFSLSIGRVKWGCRGSRGRLPTNRIRSVDSCLTVTLVFGQQQWPGGRE